VSAAVIEQLKGRFGPAILETHSNFGDDTAVVEPSKWRAVCEFLRTDPSLDFDLPVDLCGVDYPERGDAGRMEVVMHLYSISKRHRIRLKVRVGDADMKGAELESVASIWPGMNWLEREVFDMSGVRFRGHPDLRRILLYPEFEGHPLQRTYPADKTQPLVEYRSEQEAGVPLGKLEPFGRDEGMPFGRPRLQRARSREGET
jgi:NADH-quinone oxidoreductase subunit C